jgi:hypothetical protein
VMLSGGYPLEDIAGTDVKHLDSVVGHVGRKAIKILCDLRFLMEYIEERVRLVGKWNSRNHSVESMHSWMTTLWFVMMAYMHMIVGMLCLSGRCL